MKNQPLQYLTFTATVGLLLIILTATRLPGFAASRSLVGENLLVNPDFEDGFSTHGAPELKLANGWEPWWVQGTEVLYNARPEWKGEWIWSPSIRVMQGDYAQKFFTGFKTHTAGFYQRVAVPQGATLEFSTWVQVWSSDCDVVCISPLEPCRSGSNNSHGNYHLSVGIDPFGNVPSEDGAGAPSTVGWSPERIEYDDWVQLRVTAQAQADHVTVYTRGRPEWPVKHNDSYWDAASLRVVGDETETPTPTATQTTIPTLTLTPTATATHGPLDKFSYLPLIARNFLAPVPTITPTSTPSVTPSQTATFTPTPTATSTATSTPTATATPTATTVVTATPSPTPTSTGACPDIVSNGGFEEEGGWTLGTTARPPLVTMERARHGDHSLRLGITSANDDIESWSFAWQQITLPADAARAALAFWVYPLSNDDSGGDWQEAILRDANGVPMRFIMFPMRSNSQTWEQHTFDLTPYVGQTLQLWFNVYNNGSGQGVTAMYLDDVAVEVCRGAVGLARPRIQSSTVSTSDGVIGITEIRYSPDQLHLGPDCDNPEVDSRIEFLQTEVFTGTVDLTGWTLSDGVNPPFVFPSLVRQHGERVRVWSRGGLPDSPTDLHWNRPAPVWNNEAGIAILSQPDGMVRSKFCYGPGVWGSCPDVWPPSTATPTSSSTP